MCENKEKGVYIIDSVAGYICKWIELYAVAVPYAEYRGELIGIFDAISAMARENSVSVNSKIVKQINREEGFEEGEEVPFLLSTLYWQILLSQSSMEDVMRIWCGLIYGVVKAEHIDYADKVNVPHTVVCKALIATIQELLVMNTGTPNLIQ